MKESCVIKITPRYRLSMFFYPSDDKDGNELQFDLADDGRDKYVCTNLNVEEAKQIRDRLNEFIQECEK